MKKPMLDLETLKLESVQTARPRHSRGTAEALATLPGWCITFTPW